MDGETATKAAALREALIQSAMLALGVEAEGRMEIRQLKYFVRIVELGSLTRAAESLFIAQPALSQQMASLEKDLGIKLLTRSVRGVAVTQAGKAFYQQANTILKQVENARMVAKSENDHPNGMVSIGIPSSIANVLAVPLYSAIRAKYPNILLEINETPSAYLDELVINGRIDIGLLFNFSRTKGLRLRKLFSESLYLVGKKGSFETDDPIPLAEVCRLEVLAPSRTNSIRVQIDKGLFSSDLNLIPVAEINATPVTKKLALAGQGLTILPWCAIEEELSNGLLQAKLIVEPDVRRDVFIGLSETVPLSHAALCVHQLMIEVIFELIKQNKWKGVIAVDQDEV